MTTLKFAGNGTQQLHERVIKQQSVIAKEVDLRAAPADLVRINSMSCSKGLFMVMMVLVAVVVVLMMVVMIMIVIMKLMMKIRSVRLLDMMVSSKTSLKGIFFFINLCNNRLIQFTMQCINS